MGTVARALMLATLVLVGRAASPSVQKADKSPEPVVSAVGVGTVTGVVQRDRFSGQNCGCVWAITVENGNVTEPLPFRVWRVPVEQYEGKRVQLRGTFQFCEQPDGRFRLVFIVSHLIPI